MGRLSPTRAHLRMASALRWASALCWGLKTIWVIPARSRRSTKITPPWSLRVSTQPMSTASSSRCSAVRVS